MPINNFRNITTTGFDEDALFSTTTGDKVRNFSVVTTTGDLANGIYAGVDNVSVDNLGRIETSGRGAEGVLIEGAGARVRNFGSIASHGEPSDDFLHFNDAIAVYGGNFRIENWGDLSTEGIFASGVFALGDFGMIRNHGPVSTSGDLSAAVNTDGTGNQIVNFGAVSTSGQFGHGLFALGDQNRVVNFGDVHLTGELATGLRSFGIQNELVNFGTIITGRGYPMIAFGGIDRGGSNTATNWGMISADFFDGGGVLATGRGVLVQNFGTIDMTAGSGMLVAAQSGARLINGGSITTQSEFARGMSTTDWVTADGEAVNTGLIRTEGDAAAGILTWFSGGQVINDGSIETFGGLLDVTDLSGFLHLFGLAGLVPAAGILAFGPDELVRNTRTGSIESHHPDSPAVGLNIKDVLGGDTIIAADTQSHLENEGLIKAVETAVLGGPGDETVVNSGQIIGDVSLGAGDDAYIAEKGGELLGSIFGSDGADNIVFHNGSGGTRVADFEAGAVASDVLDVSAFGFESFADVLAAAMQDGSDLVIALDNNDLVVLSGVALGALHENDFLLA
jgi:hypothetical protein